ncbi:MAG: hypothetical protein KF687_12590 [Cyclobacteriaceae bacterium]|nr:hypothetical protein [Cyclobacteriaceae bacterium]
MRRFVSISVILFLSVKISAQVFTRYSYHDPEKNYIKEVFQVKDTIKNFLNGRYVSYYLNGNIESKGFFTNNETTGIWEFFYESGNLKMRGALRQNANYGLWEYFYESGQKSMEGTINGKNREGEWKIYYENGQVKEVGSYVTNRRTGLWTSFFEDGLKKGEIEYTDDFGRYTEYFHSGMIAAEGPKSGTRQVGHWRFYDEVSGTLWMEGDYENGKRTGEWITYFPSGNIAAHGKYENDHPVGKWEYFFEDGTMSSSGEYLEGYKQGYWSSFTPTGKLLSEANYDQGTGGYKEYYPSGKLKISGKVVEGFRQGPWVFYYEDGKKEGDCEFDRGKGTYYGYYRDGALQTRGEIDGDKKVGTWELYERDGTLSGYYRPYYQPSTAKDIQELTARKESATRSSSKSFGYFTARANEYKGVIVEGNPVLMFAGRFPMAVEFYSQERLGHSFEFIGIREPFFEADDQVVPGKLFTRGYSIAIKQKLYNPTKAGMWYLGHQLRFSNIGHFTNVMYNSNPETIITFTAPDQRIEYGVLLGYRIIQRNNVSGFTIDLYGSANVGYRNVTVDPASANYFQEVNQSHLITGFTFGLNIGNVFSYR